MRKGEEEVETEKKDDEEGEGPGGVHLERVAELDLQRGFDDQEEGAIVEKPGVDEEYEAEEIQLSNAENEQDGHSAKCVSFLASP